MIRPLAFAMTIAPLCAFAASGLSETPPTPTETTIQCEDGMIYDTETKICKPIQQDSRIETERAYKLVRELAYHDRHEDAQMILATMDQSDDRVLTYLGFTHRKMGNGDAAMAFYQKALASNPGNLLARSYMGQFFVESGQVELAQAQLTEINARGGRESWPAKSLRWAIASGRGASY